MGFVKTDINNNIEITFTKLGREYLIGKKRLNGKSALESLKIDFTTYGDSDFNYNVTSLNNDIITATTGDNDVCLKGTLQNNMTNFLIN